MNDLEKIELAIRRAASQMPGDASRKFRLLANEIQTVNLENSSISNLQNYRDIQRNMD